MHSPFQLTLFLATAPLVCHGLVAQPLMPNMRAAAAIGMPTLRTSCLRCDGTAASVMEQPPAQELAPPPPFTFVRRLNPAAVIGRLVLLLGALFVSGPFLMRRLQGAYVAYEAAAIGRPLITKAATSGVAYFLGDAVAQRFSPEKRIHDRGRLTRATIAGTVSHGPQLHYWTVFLEKIFPAGGLAPLLGKIALDQTIFSLYLNAAFCVLTEAIQRKPLGQALRKARAAAWPCLYAGWRFWPLAHALTYSVVPLHLRVLWVDALEVAWVAILSTCVASSGGASADEPECLPTVGCAPYEDEHVEEGSAALVEGAAVEGAEGVVVPTGTAAPTAASTAAA